MAKEPNNTQALDLKNKIEKKLTNGTFGKQIQILLFLDGVLGLAVAGGLAAAIAGVVLVMYRSRRR